MLTYSQRKSFARSGAATINATIATAIAATNAHEAAERNAAIAAYTLRTAPVPFTPEQLKTAQVIRTTTGWHRVVKVNAKSVTVATGYSWTDRHELGKILEVK